MTSRSPRLHSRVPSMSKPVAAPPTTAEDEAPRRTIGRTRDRHHDVQHRGGCHGDRADRRRLRRVDDPAVLPPARGHGRRRRSRQGRRGAARRARHPHDLGIRHGRPVLRAGIRARAGPLLGDGLPPPRHERTALRAVRRVAAVHRQVLADARLARDRRSGGRGARPDDRVVLRGVCRGRQRVPRRARRRRRVVRVRGAGAAERRLRDRALDARGLGGLAQGDGLGPPHQHRRRDRACARRSRLHLRRDRRSCIPATPSTAIR